MIPSSPKTCSTGVNQRVNPLHNSRQEQPIELTTPITNQRRRNLLAKAFKAKQEPSEDAEDQEAPSTEFLKRRPSYRSIFNDLGGSMNMISEDKGEAISGSDSSASDDHNATRVSSSTPSTNLSLVSSIYQTTSQVLSNSPSSSHPTLSSSESLHAFPSMTANHLGGVSHHGGMRSPSSGGTNAHVLQYAHQDGSSFVLPSGLSNPGLHGVSHHNGGHSPTMLSPHSLSGIHGGHGGLHGDNQDTTSKREMRLQKNREAARECRRKKKEYIKCLENRVAVLENQNKALIEELKSLKDDHNWRLDTPKIP
ncbi:hypothetical protein TCAL_05796 [Tigriopus californicus]|uniref:BZIP domain-containing protein n=1 Tax=Tigriopus californicus TaxID=6832 RepID=A0A553PNZ2_TIGCA|nr:hypothetical protein TCAL_05796 [Tigriopus californicus]